MAEIPLRVPTLLSLVAPVYDEEELIEEFVTRASAALADYDFELVFKEAARNKVALEIDCDPARMDLSPEMARLALECGCNFTMDADAHAPIEFAYVPMAAWMARRAGIPQERILNFLDVDELTASLQ